jgi:hypothetical protein
MSCKEKYFKYKNKYLKLKKQFGGNPIIPEDILFSDDDVCILRPEIKKGILIFTNYTQPANMPSLCCTGLKTGQQLKNECIYFGRNTSYPYIFFRAPYYFNPIDYTSVETEIISSFGKEYYNKSSYVWIRVDPERTNVYSSEIRAKYNPQYKYGSPQYLALKEQEVIKSKKSMNNYLQIINKNSQVKVENGMKPLYNLFSSSVQLFNIKHKTSYPFNESPINKNSEVLIRIPHLTPNYFVYCT